MTSIKDVSRTYLVVEQGVYVTRSYVIASSRFFAIYMDSAVDVKDDFRFLSRHRSKRGHPHKTKRRLLFV